MADSQDVETLKRKGRRRLVGAIALVLVAVIVLPMVFDSEPRRPPPVSVRIPSEDDPAFTPKVVPKAPPSDPATSAAAAKAESKPEPRAETKPSPEPPPPAAMEPRPEPKPEPKLEAAPKPAAKKSVPPSEAERKRAEAALEGRTQFIVQVGAFLSPEKVKEVSGRLEAAKVPFYTEQIAVSGGAATRFRAGPFPSREAASAALDQLRSLGFKPDKVTARP